MSEASLSGDDVEDYRSNLMRRSIAACLIQARGEPEEVAADTTMTLGIELSVQVTDVVARRAAAVRAALMMRISIGEMAWEHRSMHRTPHH